MDYKTKRMLAKEKSFVAKLTNSQIEKLLLSCNYVLNNNCYNEFDGKKLPAIERGYNKDDDEYVIFIRCIKQDKTANKVDAIVKSSLPHNSLNQYNLTDSIVMLKDFDFIELNLGIFEDSNCNQTYAKFMYNLFGEHYRKLYNQNVRNSIKKTTESTK